jgi:hypothetical protein
VPRCRERIAGGISVASSLRGRAVGDPVRVGLVASLAHPGRNVIGTSFLGPDLAPKRLQLLKQVIPSAVRVTVLSPLVFSNRIVNAMSWATDAPGGFAEADIELFRDLVTTFVSVLEATAGRRIYGELLATYVGRDPGAQIMAGAVKRGEVHHLKAAMLLADLRGFSRPMSFRRSRLLSSSMPSSTWWCPVS